MEARDTEEEIGNVERLNRIWALDISESKLPLKRRVGPVKI